MHTQIKRFAAAFLFAATVLVGAPALTKAATGPWSWTDISNQLTVQTNRPVWAMAYANGSWFYTDGQDLWNGGQVYRYDGATQVNITADVRNAGISRVDDIVSDGQNVLFLQNVAPRNNSLQVLAYNGTYTNLTNRIQTNLSSNEGAVQIVGSNGTLAILTTLGRVILYTQSSNTLRTAQLSWSNPYLEYQQNHTSHPIDMLRASIQPIQGNWIVLYQDGNGRIQIRKIDQYGSVSQITYPGDQYDHVTTFASNGQKMLLAGNIATGNLAIGIQFAYVYDGSNFQKITSNAPYRWEGAVVTWDGSSWMIVQGKNVYRFDGASFENLDQTRDYFITAASNGSGTILLGGAISVLGNTQPTNPLTAKLVKVVNDGGASNTNSSFGSGRTFTSNNGPTLTTMGNPSNFIVGNGGTFIYRATASDSNGINRIDLYANGARVKTCYDSTCDFSAEYFTNGLSTRAVPFYARATDNSGYSTDNEYNPDNVTINQNSTASANTNTSNTTVSNGISSWSWVEPNQTTIRRDQFMTFNTGAWSTAGLSRIDIYVNGVVRRTCSLGNATGNQNCSVSLYGGDYPLNTGVAMNAVITDSAGKTAWTPLVTLTVVDTNGTTNTNTASDISTWTTLEPTGSILNRSNSVVFHVNASASQGLSRIDVYGNNAILRTCYFNSLSGNQTCDVTIYGSNYNAGTQLNLSALATDVHSRTAWSDSKTVSIQDNNSNTTNNGNISVSSWTDPSSSINQNTSMTIHASASAPQGLSRLDVYVNGSVIRTCYFSSAYGTQNCDTSVYGGSYSVGSQLSINVKATDASSNTAWSNVQYVTIQNPNSNNTNTTNANGTSWIWSSPETSTLNASNNTVFNVGANDPNGIQKIEIYVNGSVWNTCNLGNAYGNQSCSTTINGSSFVIGTSVYVNARITDSQGNIMWSDSRTYSVTGTNTSAGTSQSSNWVWSTPETGTLASGQSATFSVGAWDQNGIQRIDMWVNGQVKHTCNLGNAYGNQTCAVTITANDYQPGTSVFVNAAIINSQGQTTWSNSRTYAIPTTNTGSTGTTGFPMNLPGSISVTSNHDAGFTAQDTITFSANAMDQNGLARIDLLVNGVLVKTCSNTATCSFTGGPYSNRTTVMYGANLVDKDGYALWTGYKTIYKK